MVAVVKPELFPGLDVFTGKEGDVWEPQVLVCGEDSTSEQVGLAHVVQEAADVSIETGIDAVRILRLVIQAEQVGVVLSHICFSFRDDLTDILADEAPLWDVLQSPDTPAFIPGSEHLESAPESVLDDTVLARPPAGTRMVALEDERGLLTTEFGQKAAALVVPAAQTELSTHADTSRAVFLTNTVLEVRYVAVDVHGGGDAVFLDVFVVVWDRVAVHRVDTGDGNSLLP